MRLQNAFGFFTTVAFVIAALIAATDLLAPRAPSGFLKTTNVQVVKGRPHYYSTKKEEYAIIKFSMDADLSSLFTWNTKQLFVYVTAEWPSAGDANATNQAVIWDSIITAPSSDHLANIGPATLKKLKKSAAGKPIDPSRYVIILHTTKSPPLLSTPPTYPSTYADSRHHAEASSPSRTSAQSTRSPTRPARSPRRTTSASACTTTSSPGSAP